MRNVIPGQDSGAEQGDMGWDGSRRQKQGFERWVGIFQVGRGDFEQRDSPPPPPIKA